jgi:outer membrane protein assembly factor BamE (lipoprotein component of BamABCDE complex)
MNFRLAVVVSILLAILLPACTSMESAPRRIAELHVGMTEQELTSLLGKPRTVTNQGALSVYEYLFTQPQPAAFHADQPPSTSYYVIVGRDGRVRSFGPN